METGERFEEDTDSGRPHRRLLSGAGILSAATLISKAVGLFYRIPLIAVIGIGGMAYFLAASHIYVTLYVVATAGLPLAVSILVSERRTLGDSVGMGRVYRSALGIFIFLGALGSMGLFFFSGLISMKIGLPDARYSIMAISPTLLFSCICASLRGYFQGCERMLPTAISEVIEAVGKLVFGLGFARYAVSCGFEKARTSAFAVFGLTVGVFLSMLYLALVKLLENRQGQDAASEIERFPLRRILRIAAPVTASSVVISIASLVDTALIPRRLLYAGLSLDEAETLYSSYGNLALPLFNLPASLITPISLALVPILASALRAGKREEEKAVLGTALRLTTILSIPASVGLSVFALPILRLLYRGEHAVEIAAPLLSILAVSVLLSALMTVTNAVLTTCGHPGYALLSMTVGAGIKIMTEYLLVGHPSVQIYGAPISTFLCNLAVSGINLYFVFSLLPIGERVSSLLWKPFWASLLGTSAAAGLFLAVRRVIPQESLCTVLAIGTAGILYLVISGMIGVFRESDLAALPLPERVLRFIPQRSTGNRP